MQQLQPRVHHAQPLVVAGKVLSLFANHFAQPLFDFGIIDIIVVHPALIAGIVGRINVDALDFSFILGQQRLERLQVIPVDNHVLAAIILAMLTGFIKAVLTLQNPIGHFLVMVDHLIFSNPFKGGHGYFLHRCRILSASFCTSLSIFSNISRFCASNSR